MDLCELKELIDLIKESDIVEVEITKGKEKVCVTRITAVQSVFAAPTAIAPVAAVPVAAAPAPAVLATSAVRDLSNMQKSPTVGTFYRAPGPNAPALVKISQQVKAGDTLCITEAMKLINKIKTEESGVIKGILIDNGTPVEYGGPLFAIG